MLDEYYLLLCCRIFISISVIISAIEVFSLREDFKRGGLFNLPLNYNFRKAYLPKLCYPFISVSISSKSFFAINILKAVAATMLLFNWSNLVFILLLSFLLFSVLAFCLAMVLGKDGADQMTLCVLLGLLIYYIGQALSDTTISNIGIIAIVAQSSLSYLTAGVAKLFGNLWKNGNALGLILSTRSFGQENINAAMSNNSLIKKSANYFVILIEIIFPLALFLPIQLSIAILGVCLVLHISIAFTMGLNRFFWTFVATYPCVIYFNINIAP